MSSTHPIVTLDLTLDRASAKEVLSAVLHAVLFHRLFGTVKPQTFEVLDVTVPGVVDPEMEQLVADRVDAFWKALEGGRRGGQITVTFSEKRARKSWFQVYMAEEEVPWEVWIINAEMRQPNSAPPPPHLATALHTILTHTLSARARAAVPLITHQAGISPFPVRVGVRVGGVEVEKG